MKSKTPLAPDPNFDLNYLNSRFVLNSPLQSSSGINGKGVPESSS